MSMLQRSCLSVLVSASLAAACGTDGSTTTSSASSSSSSGAASSSSSSSGAASSSSSTGGSTSSSSGAASSSSSSSGAASSSTAAASTSSSGGSGSTSSGGGQFFTVSGCAEDDYQDETGQGTFSISTSGTTYTPKCVKVSAGTAVTIAGSSFHPLQGQADVNGVANPFTGSSAATTAQTQTLSTPGFYGYYCTAHGSAAGTGMAGAIWVE
ncbi:MAG: hypothetical protein AB2A00_31390 [Myxococcota bacterium]